MYIAAYFLVVGIVLIAASKRPSIVFAFMLCTFVFEQWLQSKDAFFIANNSLVNLVNGSIVLYALTVKFLKAKNISLKFTIESKLIIFLYIYACFSIFWSPVPDISLDILMRTAPYILLTILLAPILISNVNELYYMSWFLVLFGVSILTLMLFFTNWDYRTIELASEFGRYTANPLAVANLAGYALIAAMFIHPKKLLFLKYFKWIVIPVSFIVIVKTGSRGQFFFMLFTLMIMSFYAFSLKRLSTILPLLFTLLFSGAIAYYSLEQNRGEDTRWESTRINEDLYGRFDAASNLLQAAMRAPESIIFGLGSSSSYDPSINGFYTHIVPLEILGELGLIGMICYLYILYFAVKAFRSAIMVISLTDKRRAYLIILASLILFEFLLSLKQGSFLGSYIFFGLIIVLDRVSNDIVKTYRSNIKIQKNSKNLYQRRAV